MNRNYWGDRDMKLTQLFSFMRGLHKRMDDSDKHPNISFCSFTAGQLTLVDDLLDNETSPEDVWKKRRESEEEVYKRNRCVLLYQTEDFYTKTYDLIDVWDSQHVPRFATNQGVVDLYESEYSH